MPQRFLKVAPSLILIGVVVAVAVAVSGLAGASDGRRLLSWNESAGSSQVRLGTSTYPRTAIDSSGYTVTIPRPTQRIVSQYWSLDEYLYSVVPPERVVAVSESAYLEGISNAYPFVKRFHPGVASDPERVLRLNPDLILVADSSRPDFCALIRDAGVPVYRAFTSFTTLDQIADTVRLTGYLTGEDDRAARVIDTFWKTINAAKSKWPNFAKPPRILGYGGQSTYGKDTLFNDIVNRLGAVNVAAEGGVVGYAPVNSEQIARWNPDWIIGGTAPGAAKQAIDAMLADPGIALTKAAHNHHIVLFDNRIFLPLSPFSASLATAIAKALYG